MRDLTYIAISDVHIGNPRIASRELYMKMKKYLYPMLSLPENDPNKVDVLFVCGDFFDTLLTMNTESSIIAVKIIDDLVALALEHNFLIRVIRGTYTHDRNQSRFFMKYLGRESNVVKVYETMALEYIEFINKWVMYTPDNLPYENQLAEMEKLMKDNQLEKVDILVNHGYFRHQLPHGITPPHNTLVAEEVREKIVPHGFCISGHVHVAGSYLHVISIGSFDRFSHGEEYEKGFYIIHDKNGIITYNHVDNHDACIFSTIELHDRGKDNNGEFGKFRSWFNKNIVQFVPELANQVHIRIKADDVALVEACAKYARETYENVVIDKMVESTKEQIIENVNMHLDELPVITPVNLSELMLPIIQKQYSNATLQDVDEVLSICDKQAKKETTET